MRVRFCSRRVPSCHLAAGSFLGCLFSLAHVVTFCSARLFRFWVSPTALLFRIWVARTVPPTNLGLYDGSALVLAVCSLASRPLACPRGVFFVHSPRVHFLFLLGSFRFWVSLTASLFWIWVVRTVLLLYCSCFPLYSYLQCPVGSAVHHLCAHEENKCPNARFQHKKLNNFKRHRIICS